MIAASLHKLAISAPLKPGVNVANLLAYVSIEFSGRIFIGFKWTMKIYFLPSMSGRVISMLLSNLPGRIKAASRVSFMLVAASTTTF